MANQPNSSPAASSASRDRVTLDLSPSVALLLDNISSVTGTPRSQLVVQAFLDALPALSERADFLTKRAGELARSSKK